MEGDILDDDGRFRFCKEHRIPQNVKICDGGKMPYTQPHGTLIGQKVTRMCCAIAHLICARMLSFHCLLIRI